MGSWTCLSICEYEKLAILVLQVFFISLALQTQKIHGDLYKGSHVKNKII